MRCKGAAVFGNLHEGPVYRFRIDPIDRGHMNELTHKHIQLLGWTCLTEILIAGPPRA